MRLGPRERKRVHAFREAAGTLRLSEPDAAAALPSLVKELLQTDHALVYDLTVEGQTTRFGTVHGAGLDMSLLVDRTNRWFAKNGFNGAYDPRLPDARQRNRAMSLSDIAGLTGVERWKQLEELHPLVGVPTRDQLRVLVCEGPSLLAWVGGFQADDYSAEQRAMLEAVVPVLQRRLSLGQQLAPVALTNLLRSALELIAGPAFVLDSAGRVRQANELGIRLIDSRHAETRSRLAHAIAAPERFGAVRVHDNGLPDHFLVVLPVGDSGAPARLAAAARKWGLTPRQLQILDCLARGYSNRRIAAELKCAETTVETHVSAVLQKARLESRSRLLAVLLALPERLDCVD